MFKQLDIFDQPASCGEHLANVGMQLAVDHADQKVKSWSQRCWQLFLWWLRRNVKHGTTFMIEDFREYVKKMDLLEEPPSNRAFGFLSKVANEGGWIEYAGTGKVKNRKAHSARASLWRKKYIGKSYL